MRTLIAVGLVLLGAVAGCAAPEPGPLEDREPPGDDAEFLPVPSIQLEDCQGAMARIPLPENGPRVSTPPGFHPRPGPAGLVDLFVEAYACHRIIVGTNVTTDAALVWIHLGVVPTNGSWGQPSFYTLDVLTDAAPLAAVLDAAGARASLAAISIEAIGGEAVGVLHERWVAAEANRTYRFEWSRGEQAGASPEARLRHHWLGDDPYQRLDLVPQASLARPLHHVAGTLTTEGASALPDLPEPIPLAGDAFAPVRLTLDVSPTPFQSEDPQP